jgi:hypothetical protein
MSLWSDLPELAAAARRPLPPKDAAIEALTPEDRALFARLWTERAANELGAGAVFAAIASGLFAEGAGPEVLWLASRAVCDEIRHAELCRHVASCYAGRDLPRPAPPVIGEGPRSAGVYAVLNGAIHETIGSAVLTACHEEAEGAMVRAAVRELLADEVDHARVGWALLGADRLAPRLRCEVSTALPALVRLARERWLARAEELPESLPRGHGCLPRGDVVEVVEHALRSLVLPGFSHVGLDPGPAAAALG